ncbi:interleukin-15 receptor subunit alpha isoform X2 [Castor canadensis]|uniref:Interleukin-15 receptor subunit alpha isoform X2 n=1 Tax=Castor canadensis TaxID=51338 RepID=A0AC58L6P3_CASCN
MSPLRTSPQPSGGQSKSESECAWLAAGPGAALATSPGPVHRTRGWPGASRRGTAGRATMAPRRLRDGRVHALLALLLLLLLLWPPVTRGTTCPTPTSVEHADIRVKSYNVNSRERYVCNSGFKRKAGTSSLIQCVLNETTNIAHWTTPNLKCIQPTALFPKSDTTVATETAIIPGTQLTPSQPASAGTTGIGSHESSQTPSQTTARVLESTPFTSHEITGVHPYSSKQAIVTISTSVSTFCTVLVMLLLLWCFRSRQTSQPPAVEVERMEVMPMTPGTSSREEEDTGIYPHSP